MARNERQQAESFSHCQYSFLNRMLQPFHRQSSSHSSSTQVNALPDSKARRARDKRREKTISKSTIDLNLNNTNQMKTERCILQIGRIANNFKDFEQLSDVDVISKPKVTGVFVCVRAYC